MTKFTVKQYDKNDYQIWNDFISQAKNATFLFCRDFMEYHQDRFEDFSLLVFEDEKLISVLPANKTGNSIYSHQGLTYGGLVCKEQTKLATVIEIFRAILLFLMENNFQKLHLKSLPSIYHLKPAEEILYALFLAEAKLVRRDSLSVIDLSQENKTSKIRKRGFQKGVSNQLIIEEETDFDLFWNEVLIPNLNKKHSANPVHSVKEMNYLKTHFPKNIHQFNVYFEDKIVAGTTVFETETVAHCQYISKNENQENLGSLDYLFHYLIQERFAGKRFFDFGISNENQGRNLNEGLAYWKESFGASTIIHDFYEVETSNYNKLNGIFV
ncbi:acetyltransferase (GNAT) family protein [Flavobacterium sp. 90]|uniref:GNAT family N-acetyltransferase n=1 Tax=unclassified Flavobacterium TaxID=196869 RepID=UPI000EAC8500|nr:MULTISPECIES: GNAT family N-acetyltransferase [unclassified Flavobacterium]RKR08686.1 acetyltransferase (GNAT) family protein [Flavobacterium sp. 81]TCK52473.1 acetyltransferase (GNAT) family protein [Flavobacterium sp. 90]